MPVPVSVQAVCTLLATACYPFISHTILYDFVRYDFAVLKKSGNNTKRPLSAVLSVQIFLVRMRDCAPNRGRANERGERERWSSIASLQCCYEVLPGAVAWLADLEWI